MSETNKPIKTFRMGALKLTVWKNEVEYNGKKSDKFTGTLVTVFKDKEDKWQQTPTIDSKSFATVSLIFAEASKMGLVVRDE